MKVGSKVFVLGWLWLGASQTSMAQERVCETFTEQEFHGLMEHGRTALAEGAFFVAHKSLSRIYDELRCLETRIGAKDIAQYAELAATMSLMDQDEEGARRWTQLRLFILPKTPWMLEAPESFRSFLELVPHPEVATVSGAGVHHPKGQVFLMNGMVAKSLTGPIEVPVFIQLIEKRGTVTNGFWQDGVRFRDEMIASRERDAKMPTWASRFSSGVQEGQGTGRAVVVGGGAYSAKAKEKGWISNADPKEWMPECKWVGTSVHARVRDEHIVLINELSYDLTLAKAELALKADLQRCHDFIAEKRLVKWRSAVQNARRVGAVTNTDLDSVFRAFKHAAHEISAEVHRSRFLSALNKVNEE